jgi:hypothetical protein
VPEIIDGAKASRIFAAVDLVALSRAVLLDNYINTNKDMDNNMDAQLHAHANQRFQLTLAKGRFSRPL